MIIVFVFTLVLLVLVTVKVTKMTWQQDKVLPCMLFNLCFSMVSCINYYAYELYTEITYASCYYTHRYICSTNFAPMLPEFFLGIAITLNVSKWIYFLWRITTFIKIEKQTKAL